MSLTQSTSKGDCFSCRFNAVVSKTVNKHGDHAVSYSGHARHFYPIGHGIKINHYFPGKDYKYNEAEKNENETVEKESKPVSEISSEKVETMKGGDVEGEIKEKVSEKKEMEMQSIVSEGDSAQLKVKEIPTVVPMIMQQIPKENEESMVLMPVVEPVLKDALTETTTTVNEDQATMKKEDLASDSELASSYYHSRVYFVRY